jgi:regulator of sigma E protease
VNVVLAVVLLAGLFMEHYPKIPTPKDPVVGYVVPDGGAAKAGVRPGDKVVQIGDVVDPTWEDISMKEIVSPGRPMQVWVMRNGERLHLSVTPVLDEKQGIGLAKWAPESEVEVDGYVPGIDVAEKAGIQKGDILVSADGEPVRSVPTLHDILKAGGGKPVDLVYSRNGERHEVKINPVKSDTDGQERWMIGVGIASKVEIVKLPFDQALVESLRENGRSAKLIFQFLENMIERRMSPKSIVGPVAIAQLSGQAAREGAATFIGLMAAVSLNLAIFNLLPIPILDGGVILLLAIEGLMRRDISLNLKERIYQASFVFLVLFAAIVVFNDIAKMR